MAFLIGLLTVIMVLDCLVLMFLVLIQLPKKEAGAGLAFGGAASDALFGAGSGNVLTKITKYTATVFFVLAVILSMLQRNFHTRTMSEFESQMRQGAPPPSLPMTVPPSAAPPASSPAPATKAPSAVPGANTLTVAPPAAEETNLPMAIPANPAPATPPKK